MNTLSMRELCVSNHGYGQEEVMSSLTIRDLKAGDIDAVLRFWVKTGLTREGHYPEASIAFSSKSANSTILVAEKNDELVGTVMAGHDGHWGWIYYLGVACDWRALGLGKRLLTTAENWLRVRGVAKVNLLVMKDNLDALSFYDRMGYSEFPAVSMQKKL